MATYVLEILDGDRAGETLPVADRTLRIGRKPGNDLVLADEKTSGVHAEVVVEGDRHVLRDLGSTNGTFLDGKRVTEIVLTPGDIVTVGRLRVKFREEGAAAAPEAGDLAVRRLDASRLQRRSGSTALLGVLVLVGLGVGGWLWWQGRASDGDGEGEVARGAHAPLAIPGNRLAAALASCEGEEGWNLRAAGGAFQQSGQKHSGGGAFEAVRAEGAEAADFAVLRLAEPVPALAGRTMTLVAHLRSEGAAKIALRALCFTNGDAVPFRFRTGTPFAAHEGWQRVETVVAVPPGCDRLQFEVAAVLPDAASIARVDDVAILEAGQATPIERKLAESGQTLLGTESAVAIRSVDADNPATLLSIEPAVVPDQLAGLQRAGLAVLSDIGATLATTATERAVQCEAKGTTALAFVFPGEAAGGLLVANGEEGFTPAPSESEFQATRVLLGDRSTRVLVHFDAPVACRGQLGGGTYRLTAQAAKAELVTGFRAERGEAADIVRQAKGKQQAQPGAALDLVRDLVRRVPLDSEMLSQAQTLRTEILAQQSDAMRRLQQDLEQSEFFDTRGGFERVVLGLDDLVAVYGEQNLEDAASAKALRGRAAARLAGIDAANSGMQRQRLDSLAKALTESNQPGLAKLVSDYSQRHLGGSEPTKETEPRPSEQK